MVRRGVYTGGASGHKAGGKRQMRPQNRAEVKNNECSDVWKGEERQRVVTKLDVLVVSQHQDDVGPDVPGVAVPLQSGAESVPWKVAGGVASEGEEEKADKEQEGELMEAGGEPRRCHDDADQQSPPQASASHVGGVGDSLKFTWRREREREGREPWGLGLHTTF